MGAVRLALPLFASALLADTALARCPDYGTVVEPERIRQCMEDLRRRPGAGPETLFHWGHPDSVARMMTLPREAFCGFNDSRQLARRQLRDITYAARRAVNDREVPKPERETALKTEQEKALEKALADMAGALPASAFHDEATDESELDATRRARLDGIADRESASRRVAGYLELFADLLERRDALVEESSCQRERTPGPDCSSVDPSVDGKRLTAQRLDALSRALVQFALAVFSPRYRAPVPAGSTPVDPDDAEAAAESLRGYLMQIEPFVEGGTRSGSGTYPEPPRYSTTWGTGVYFAAALNKKTIGGHFNGDGIACHVGGRRVIDAFGRATVRVRDTDEEGDPLAQERSVRKRQLTRAKILEVPSAVNNDTYRHFVHEAAFEEAMRGELIRFEPDVFVDKCAIEYRHCKAITISDFEDCTAIAEVVSRIPSREDYESPSSRPDLFRYLRDGPTDDARRDDTLGPTIFDSRLINEWLGCVKSQSATKPQARAAPGTLANLCPDSLQGRRNLIGRRTGPNAGIYTDSEHSAGKRYGPLVREIAGLCRELSSSTSPG